MIQLPYLLPNGDIGVGSCCDHSYYFRDGKFYDTWITENGTVRNEVVTEPSKENIGLLALFREGTYFDASSENKSEWHHKYEGKPRAYCLGEWVG